MTPRILHLIPAFDCSGAEKQLRLLARGLLQAGFDTHVCLLAPSGPTPELAFAGIQPTIVERRWNFDPCAWWNLKRLVEHLRPDVVHAWQCTANAYGLATMLGGSFKRLIAGYRSMEPVDHSLKARLDREIGRRSTGLVANSRGVKNFYVKNGLPENKFNVIDNAVELPVGSNSTRQQILDELGLPENSRLIGMVGRLMPHKRFKDAIWAADLLKVVRKDVHLLIFGDGPHFDRLHRFREQVRIEDHVHFLGNRTDLQRFYPHFDLLWSTSAYEGQSNAILEAMAAGVPIVASDIPGNRELVVAKETGVLVPVGDRGGFAREAHRLLETPELARQLGEAGRERVRREFTVEKMVGKYLDLYSQLL
jgi:glycosyltransferase involved in cell wall biosynthesis